MTDLPSTKPNTAAGPAVPGARLATRGATIAHERHVVSRNLDANVPAGVFTTIVGPSACGRSTLLHALARLYRPARGAVLLDGADIARLGTGGVTHRVGLLPQSATMLGGVLVRDPVACGRFPHQGLFRQWSQQDRQAVKEAVEMVGVTELVTRLIDELSGGQRQHVWVVLALTQGIGTILLDEPTTFLDLAHQVDIFQLCRRLNTDGRTVMVILHDLNQTAHYAEHMIVVHESRVRTTGSPHEILTEDFIEKVFDLVAVTASNPVAGTPIVVSRHLGAVMPAGSDPARIRSAPTDSTGGPTPQSSTDPVSARTGPTVRSQRNGQERSTNR